ncbi:cation:proton antiporter [Bdellovibrio sp. HCB337]|uniref:cation:proton antiporter n=1 Tax=Bdellovibrio sp. HCB337 TaxID=3394358 RepID=UPI0039A4F560
MKSAMWFALIGVLFIVMAVISAALKRLPLTTAIIYLLIGFILGESVFGIITVEPLRDFTLLRVFAEITVIVSLFTAGLKLRLPLNSPEWKAPLRLATVSMAMTIFLLSLFAVFVLGFTWGEAILLAAVLAPTDPVLASSVQVLGPADQDQLRFSLTAEAGLNDGTSFPFVMLGLGMLGLRTLGPWGSHWLLFDVVWGICGGLLIGTLLGAGIGKVVIYLRTRHEETETYDDFLALGLVGLSYGLTVLLHAYGFLAVFAAGLALRKRERRESHHLQAMQVPSSESFRIDTISGHMALGVLEFNEQMERLGELSVVIFLGAMVSQSHFSAAGFYIALFLFIVARPLSVLFGIRTHKHSHKILISWFGIRGVGSLYYLAFALEQGLTGDFARKLTEITLMVVVVSIVLHGLSAAPLMIRHSGRE